MDRTRARLSVFFEDPFWVGLYERESQGGYEVCRVVFGAQPSDREVYQYFLDNWHTLRFGPVLPAAAMEDRPKNPKRMQREAQKTVQNTGLGTRAQQALKLQHEQGKQQREVRSKEQREAQARRLFALRKEKRKEKHKGR